MEGLYNHTGDAPPQPFIPFFLIGIGRIWFLGTASCMMTLWKDGIRAGNGRADKARNLGGRKYLTTYLKQQKVSFGTISVDRNGVPDSYSGNAVIGEGYASVLDEEAVLKYTFEVTAGTYDVAVEIVYPRWDRIASESVLMGQSDAVRIKAVFLILEKKFWRILKVESACRQESTLLLCPVECLE